MLARGFDSKRAITKAIIDALGLSHDSLVDVSINDHHNEVHTVDKHTDRTVKRLYHPSRADDWMRSGYWGVAKLTDAQSKYVEWSIMIPTDFVSLTSFKVVWWNPTLASGNLYWLLSAQGGTGGETRSNWSEGGTLGVTATGGTNILNVQEPATTLAYTDLSAEDFLGFMMYAPRGNALDTLDGDDVRVVGLLLTYIANQ